MQIRKWVWVTLFLGVLVAIGFLSYQFWPSDQAAPYRTAQVEKGRLVATVSASGTLNAVTTVQVGSQVSGQLKEVLADFNSEVKAGQIIARLDPQTFEYRVNQAQADLDAARANALVQQAQVAQVRVNLQEAQRVAERNTDLVNKNFISSAELERTRATAQALEAQLNSAQAQVVNAQALVRQREAALAQARVELERTVIRAPVSGVVVKRSVEPGQTVAASLQAPELFIIARDLRDMQVEVAVDEADIGRIKAGQRVNFSVDAYAGRRFSGEVRQIRKAAQSAQNVVTYTVIVSAPNEDLSLLPGMTANVRVVTDVREQVLKVPNAALRFRPADAEPAPRIRGGGRDAATATQVYSLNSDGKPQAISLKIGISDGSFTEVLSGELQQGLALIVGLAPTNASNSSTPPRAPRMMF
jgi:HlyD family secretion protein